MAEVVPNVENPKLGDIDVILENLNEEKDKNKKGIVVISYIGRDQNVQKTEMEMQ